MTRLLVDGVWDALGGAARACKSPSFVAVAYVAKGGGDVLKLKKGSRLVVDASPVVRAGLTHPDTLASLVRRGVRVFSYSGLHAKVFVFGRQAFVGSANVSASSRLRLQEAALACANPNVVAAARAFVRLLCVDELTPRISGGCRSNTALPRGRQRVRCPLRGVAREPFASNSSS